MKLLEVTTPPNDYVRSYKYLRFTVGVIGIMLPIVLMLGSRVAGQDLPESISHYYYTCFRDIFVGSLCAVGMFMFFYVGPRAIDNWVGNFAGIGALGTALIATSLPKYCDPYKSKELEACCDCILNSFPVSCLFGDIYPTIHYVFATLLLVAFAVFALFLFQHPDDANIPETPWMARRKLIYYLSGGVMVAAMVVIVVGQINEWQGSHTLWGEAAVLWAFGVAWFTKGFE